MNADARAVAKMHDAPLRHRTPTPPEVAYAWHRAMLTGARPQTTTEPQCGFFLRSTGRKGHPQTRYIPASIYLDQPTDPETGELTGPEVMRCEVGGSQRDAGDEWTWLAGRPISEDEYMRLLAEAFGEDEPEVTAPGRKTTLSDGSRLDF